VRPWFPARTVPEFIAYAKANPGKLKFGKASIGTMAHTPTHTKFTAERLSPSHRAFKKFTRSIFCWSVNPIPNR
jgi:tripartite-type tricarboxylate transporter receptor subunit TctC